MTDEEYAKDLLDSLVRCYRRGNIDQRALVFDMLGTLVHNDATQLWKDLLLLLPEDCYPEMRRLLERLQADDFFMPPLGFGRYSQEKYERTVQEQRERFRFLYGHLYPVVSRHCPPQASD